MVKNTIKTWYLNPILKIWEDELTTRYLKKDFKGWYEDN